MGAGSDTQTPTRSPPPSPKTPEAQVTASSRRPQPLSTWCWADLGEAYLRSGQTEKAITCLQDALRMRRASGSRRGEAIALQRLGRAYKAKRPLMAHKLLTEALRLAEDLDDTVSAAKIRAELATVTESDFGTA